MSQSLYEILVMAEGPLRGHVCAIQKSPANWGRKECPPKFYIAQLLLDDNVKFEPNMCKWDFKYNQLISERTRTVKQYTDEFIMNEWYRAWSTI